jgi:hypothetical protein
MKVLKKSEIINVFRDVSLLSKLNQFREYSKSAWRMNYCRINSANIPNPRNG